MSLIWQERELRRSTESRLTGGGSKRVRFLPTPPHPRMKDITGMRHGRLCIRERLGSDGRDTLWLADCDCGSEIALRASDFRRVQSCGCWLRARLRRVNRTHGRTHEAIYSVWRSMLARCENPKHPAWGRYGGRGIVVCARWAKFENFYADMEPTYRKGLTIERIDNNAGYHPQNCRWATRKAQARNTRSNHEIDTPLGKMLLVEAAEVSGIGKTTLLYRANAAWPVREMFRPPDTRNRFSTF